jgi:cytochrome c oxidase subunit 3
MEQQAEASSLGMWVFLATEVLFFGGLFLEYVVYRRWYPAAFAAASGHMDTTLGVINTMVLLVSSFTVVAAVHAGRLGRRGGQTLLILATIVLGLIFLGIKAAEYRDHAQHGLFPN